MGNASAVATSHDGKFDFFTRLIPNETTFDPHASHAGREWVLSQTVGGALGGCALCGGARGWASDTARREGGSTVTEGVGTGIDTPDGSAIAT